MLQIFTFLQNIKIPAGLANIGDPTPKYLAVPALGDYILSQIFPASHSCHSRSSGSPSMSARWQPAHPPFPPIGSTLSLPDRCGIGDKWQ